MPVAPPVIGMGAVVEEDVIGGSAGSSGVTVRGSGTSVALEDSEGDNDIAMSRSRCGTEFMLGSSDIEKRK